MLPKSRIFKFVDQDAIFWINLMRCEMVWGLKQKHVSKLLGILNLEEYFFGVVYEILKCNHSNESSWIVLSCGTVCCALLHYKVLSCKMSDNFFFWGGGGTAGGWDYLGILKIWIIFQTVLRASLFPSGSGLFDNLWNRLKLVCCHTLKNLQLRLLFHQPRLRSRYLGHLFDPMVEALW